MIYLFCNQTYGQAFLDMALKFSRTTGVNITIIFSGKYARPNRNKTSWISSWHIRHIKRRIEEMSLRYRLKMRTLIVENVNSPSFYERICSEDHGIVAGFNQIFKPATIYRFDSLVNFHPSILPLYRGPVPSYWCIRNREEQTGYTLHKLTERIDEGEILFQEAILIGNINDPETLDKKIASFAAEQFWKYLEDLQTGRPQIKKQLEATTIYKNHINYASFPSSG